MLYYFYSTGKARANVKQVSVGEAALEPLLRQKLTTPFSPILVGRGLRVLLGLYPRWLQEF